MMNFNVRNSCRGVCSTFVLVSLCIIVVLLYNTMRAGIVLSSDGKNSYFVCACGQHYYSQCYEFYICNLERVNTW